MSTQARMGTSTESPGGAPVEATRVERQARLGWVPIAAMAVSPAAQRELNRARVDHIVANFDPEQIGAPTVNARDGRYYILDGQHRVEALREVGWGDQQVECWVYEDLTEQQEAERFLALNDVLAVDGFAKFRVGLTAGRGPECDIDGIVRAAGLSITRDRVDGGIRAVATLRRVYLRGGPDCLARALRLIRDAYGTPGLEGPVIDGIGLLCQRYPEDLDDTAAVGKLSRVHGGVHGLLGKADQLRRATGKPKAHCVAAAAVEVINTGRGGKKLPSWWRTDTTPAIPTQAGPVPAPTMRSA